MTRPFAFALQLQHNVAKQVYVFSAEDGPAFVNWVTVLKQALAVEVGLI